MDINRIKPSKIPYPAYTSNPETSTDLLLALTDDNADISGCSSLFTAVCLGLFCPWTIFAHMVALSAADIQMETRKIQREW